MAHTPATGNIHTFLFQKPDTQKPCVAGRPPSLLCHQHSWRARSTGEEPSHTHADSLTGLWWGVGQEGTVSSQRDSLTAPLAQLVLRVDTAPS